MEARLIRRLVGIAVEILPAELSNNKPEDIVQESVSTSHDLPPSKPPMSSRYLKVMIRMEDSFKELLFSQHADICESANIEEPNVNSTENEKPTELVNAEVEIILE
ncbi:hypothetical protein K3495_g14595 [Podosphaera aphanis]|nr:hypothetical protein K3495_g14595 [Podosphaera aphanis]